MNEEAPVGSIFCPVCRLEQPTSHSYCPRCGSQLPVNLLEDEQPAKRGRFFAGVRVHEADSEGGFLRVSCYRYDQTFGEGETAVTIPGHHVRFSVWIGDSARCAISIPEAEARELIGFLTAEVSKMSVPQRAPTERGGG